MQRFFCFFFEKHFLLVSRREDTAGSLNVKVPDAASSSSTCQTRQTEQTRPELLQTKTLGRSLDRRLERNPAALREPIQILRTMCANG